MKRWGTGLATALIAVLSGWAGAQEAVRVEVVAEAPLLEPPLAAEGVGPGPSPVRNAIKNCLNRHGLGCNAHHSWFGCGSLRSELTFIFGSCRTFYGEPCFPKPPRGTAPTSTPYGGAPYGSGTSGNGAGGCAGCR